MRGVWHLAEPAPIKTVYRAWRTLTERHEILRTVFTLGPDLVPQQSVFAADGFRMPVTTAPLEEIGRFSDGRPVPLAGVTHLTLPPWRAVLFVSGELVHTVGVVAEHIICDGTGIANWEQQLRDLCAGRDPSPPAVQPLDRLKGEEGAVRAVDSRPMTLAPHKALPGTADGPADPRYLLLKAEYGGLTALVNTVARRNRVTPAAVLMFVVAWIICRYGNRRHVYFANLSANRNFRDHGIDCQMLPVDLLVEVDESRTIGESLNSVLRQIFTGLAQAGRGEVELHDGLPRAAADRGVGAITPITFNYDGEWQDAAVGGEGAPLCLSEKWSPIGEPFVTDVTANTVGEDFVVSWDVDTAMFPPDAVREFAELVPRIISALQDPDAPVHTLNDLSPEVARPTDDCALVGVDWVRLPSVDRMLQGCPGVSQARTTVEADELTAHLSLAEGVHPFDVHEYLLSQLHRYADVMAPQAYRVENEDAKGATGPWRPGSCTPELLPESQAERDLLEAIGQVHGAEGPVNMASTYVGAGGRVLLVPAVTEVLRRLGWSGARPHHFTSPCTLRSIARQLVAQSGRNAGPGSLFSAAAPG
jgi:hypothetical protein